MAEKEKSLSLNSVYYLIYNFLNVVFPLITGIYVAHVLLSSDIGRIEAARNLSTYFVIFSFLGIPTYGLREIARARKDKEDLNKTYSELMVINAISTGIFSVLYIGLIFIVPQYRDNSLLYLLSGINILLNFINNSWLFEGLEKFGFISLRNLIFKIVSFLLLILLVRNENDFLWYLVITIVGTAGNYILNIIGSPRYVKFTLKELNLKRHLKPIMYLTMVNLAIEIYSLVDVTMLNFMCNEKIVAYYSYGMKVFRILLQIVNTFTMVLVPRIALYYKEGREEEFNELISKTLTVICLLAAPMIVGIWFTSDFLIPAIYGEEYLTSSYVLKILSFILIISPIGYLLGSRMLLVSGHENKMIIAVGSGAIVNLGLNFLLIYYYKEIGASIASVLGEVTVMVVYVFLGRYYYKLNKSFFNTIWKEAVALVLMTGALFGLSFLPLSQLLITIIQILSALVIYGGVLLLLKENITVNMTKRLIGRFVRHG